MQPFAQSSPKAGGGGVAEGCGVGVSGAGVELGVPGRVVAVGATVSVTVAVGALVQVGSGVCVGGTGAGRLANVVIKVTMMPPTTVIIAAITAESIFLLSPAIYKPLPEFCLFYVILDTHSRVT